MAWLTCAVVSVAAFARTEPSGDSFLRGINRVGVFLGWHAVAFVFALSAFVAGRQLSHGWTRRLTLGPIALYAAFVVLVLLLIIWSRAQGWIAAAF